MARHDDRSKDNSSKKQDTNPFRPVSLTPMKLRNDPALQISSAEVRAHEMPLVNYGDHSNPTVPISEHRFDFAPIQEVRPELRLEKHVEFALRPIIVTPVQMQQLRERRVAARDLGWSIQGHRIRIGE